MPLLKARDIVVRFGRATALSGVSIALEPGDVHAVVGPNGAGKSTLLHALNGSVTPVHGEAWIDGEPLSGLSPAARARRGIAIVPQGRQLFPRLSVLENLRVMARIVQADSHEVDAAIDRFPILRRRARVAAGMLSGGEQQMLVVSRALLAKPRVLLLDEVGCGLAPLVVEQVLAVAREFAEQGGAVILAEPMVRRVASVVTAGSVLVRGAIVDHGRCADELDAALERAIGIVGTDDAPSLS